MESKVEVVVDCCREVLSDHLTGGKEGGKASGPKRQEKGTKGEEAA